MHGLDLEMGTDVADYQDYFFAKPLLTMVQEGKIPESIVDDKVRRLLRGCNILLVCTIIVENAVVEILKLIKLQHEK